MNALSAVTPTDASIEYKPDWVDPMFQKLKSLINKTGIKFWLGEIGTGPAYNMNPLSKGFNPAKGSIAASLPLNPNAKDRITVIDNDGYVFWDNVINYTQLANHNTRKEVQGALNGSNAWAARVSDALNNVPYRYVAIYLSDETGFGRTIRYSQSV